MIHLLTLYLLLIIVRAETRLSSPNHQYDLINMNDLAIKATLYIGSNFQPMHVLIDTKSDLLTIQMECTEEIGIGATDTGHSCPAKTLYASSKSTEFKPLFNNQITFSEDFTSNLRIESYGVSNTYQYKGYDATDRVCIGLNLSTCAADFQLFASVSANSKTNEGFLGDTSGVLGLSRAVANDTGLIAVLHSQGVIDKAQLVLKIRERGTLSQLEFGSLTASFDATTAVTLPMVAGSKLWQFEIAGIRFGESDEFKVGQNSMPAVIDTTSSFIQVPRMLWAKVFDRLADKVTLYYQKGWTTVQCDDKNLQSISLLVGGHWVELRPQDYLIDVSSYEDRSVCAIMFKEATIGNEWTLGLPFLRSFEAIFDFQNDTFSLSPQAGSSKKLPYLVSEDLYPSESMPDPTPWFEKVQDFLFKQKKWFIFASGSLLTALGSLVMFYISGIFKKDSVTKAIEEIIKEETKSDPADIVDQIEDKLPPFEIPAQAEQKAVEKDGDSSGSDEIAAAIADIFGVIDF